MAKIAKIQLSGQGKLDNRLSRFPKVFWVFFSYHPKAHLISSGASLVAAQCWEANVQVHRRGLELIRPGARCRDIAAELNDLFASLGLLKYRYENLRPEEVTYVEVRSVLV